MMKTFLISCAVLNWLTAAKTASTANLWGSLKSGINSSECNFAGPADTLFHVCNSIETKTAVRLNTLWTRVLQDDERSVKNWLGEIRKQ